MAKHAKLSPSSSARWLACPASTIMEAGKPNTTSSYAAEGTLAHHLAEEALLEGHNIKTVVGSAYSVNQFGNVAHEKTVEDMNQKEGTYTFEVDTSMADFVNQYLTTVNSVKDATGGELFVEQRLSLEKITGEKGAKGTADAVIVAQNELFVIDLKYGQGVQVEAENNSQLMLYALAALQVFDFTGDIETVTLIISQPRKHHTSEWSITASDLREWGVEVSAKAEKIRSLNQDSDLTGLFNPTEAACKWCKASAECKPYAEYVHETVMDNFKDLNQPLTIREATMDSDQLAEMYSRVELIKGWVKTVENTVYEKLMAGEAVTGLKLVTGRAGARKWSKEAAAEARLKAVGLGEGSLFKKKLISPTDAEKLAKAGELSKEDWQEIQDLIVKPEGRPVIASGDDPREGINPLDVFTDLTK